MEWMHTIAFLAAKYACGSAFGSRIQCFYRMGEEPTIGYGTFRFRRNVYAVGGLDYLFCFTGDYGWSVTSVALWRISVGGGG